MMDKIKILFLAANPVNTPPLRLGEEVNRIDEELLKSRFRNKFDLEQKHAVKASALSLYLMDAEPDIVHFSGHGSRAGQIYLENAKGKSKPIRVKPLSDLFSLLKKKVRCVVLNACYSEVQALIITRHIDCVIGMSKAIGDEAAINFAQGFYRGIGGGKDLETAFKLGCIQIDIQDLDEQDTPKIHWKNDEPKKIFLGEPSPISSPKAITNLIGHKPTNIAPSAFAVLSYVVDKDFNFALLKHTHHKKIQPPGRHLEPNEYPDEEALLIANKELDLPLEELKRFPPFKSKMYKHTRIVPTPFQVQLEKSPQRTALIHYDFVYVFYIDRVKPPICVKDSSAYKIEPDWYSIENVEERQNDKEYGPHEDMIPTMKRIKMELHEFLKH